LGGSSAGANREYGVIDTNRDDVAEVESIFAADWGQATWVGPADGRLVVSPVNARSALAALIDSAHGSLWIEDEEMYDRRSEDALIAAARRGVRVEVVLPSSAVSTAGSGGSGADIAYLAQGGVHVRLLVAPYMHAKLLVVDALLAFIGSENFSVTSLDENRELGIVLAEPSTLAIVGQTFIQDWALATDAA
jgi:phosphatidylserine/phosphatidylglycerophosphate/cardiolipin synthase-like enzyme